MAVKKKSSRRRAFLVASAKFQTIRKAEIKKFVKKHGHKPKGKNAVQQYIQINKAAGRAYHKKY